MMQYIFLNIILTAPKDPVTTAEPKKRKSFVDNADAVKTIIRARSVGTQPDSKPATGADKKGPPQKAALKGVCFSDNMYVCMYVYK